MTPRLIAYWFLTFSRKRSFRCCFWWRGRRPRREYDVRTRTHANTHTCSHARMPTCNGADMRRCTSVFVRALAHLGTSRYRDASSVAMPGHGDTKAHVHVRIGTSRYRRVTPVAIPGRGHAKAHLRCLVALLACTRNISFSVGGKPSSCNLLRACFGPFCVGKLSHLFSPRVRRLRRAYEHARLQCSPHAEAHCETHVNSRVFAAALPFLQRHAA